ncbi:MAG: small, acid-soluble spore protein, alpha/beta type [Eubacteriales bacterium]|nr:small, acid-soluble spore protein, alpha/beta type [Eubacteriales bacterium]
MNKDKEVKAYLQGELSEEEKIKYEIAEELGILDKVLEGGWKSLSAKETGRIGGLMTRKRKAKQVS